MRSLMLQFSGNMSVNWQLAGGIRLAPESINKGTFTMLRQRALPLIPVWPGFAVNTLLYAAALWLLCAIPLHVRRRVRMKRGRCPACGYELRGSASDVCSECGAAVARPQITR